MSLPSGDGKSSLNYYLIYIILHESMYIRDVSFAVVAYIAMISETLSTDVLPVPCRLINDHASALAALRAIYYRGMINLVSVKLN